MSEKIENVFTFQNQQGEETYIYSLKKENDKLGYDYYLLFKDNNNHFTIYESVNTIKLLQINNIQLIPITKNNPKYIIFLSELFTALDNEKENQPKEAMIRK